MKIKLFKFILTISTISLFNSCGSGACCTKNDFKAETKLNKTQIPICNGSISSTTNAIKIYNLQEIEKVKSNTTVRIWHYQNGDKLVCTVTGKATIKNTTTK